MKMIICWSVEFEVNSASGREQMVTQVMCETAQEAREIIENYYVDDECVVANVEREDAKVL